MNKKYEDKYKLRSVHAPDKWRIIGTLKNSKEFRETFSCTPGDNMYEENICEIW